MSEPVKAYPTRRTKREAVAWLFITAVNDHIMRCESALFPETHPECQDLCCPNCCGTCFTLRWYRDQEDRWVTRLLNQYGEGLYDWQLADGSVDWAQIEAHWDDTGASCGREKCLQETAMRNGMGLLTVAELKELGAV